MLQEERFLKILNMLTKKHSVTVHEVMQQLQVSEATTRRDLTLLNEQGKLIKVHGGAIAVGSEVSTLDADVSERVLLHQEEKKNIACYAAALIEPGDYVYLDAGTTVGFMIEYITQKEAVYVTNAIGHARALSKSGCSVYLLGGKIKPLTEAVVGGETVEQLQRYHFTKGFFGTNGIHPKYGYTTPDAEEAKVKEIALKHCRKAYILSDASKFNQIASVGFAPVSAATVLTDSVPELSYKQATKILEVPT
jgi:DeoR family fructose operon transcriptional repressor